MYKNKKIMIGILSLGVLLGQFESKTFAEPEPTHLWDDSGLHEESISGDDLRIRIDQNTTLVGTVTGSGLLKVDNSSLFKGEVTGPVVVTVDHSSSFTGNVTGSERVELNHSSSWKGDFSSDVGSGLIMVENSSLWKGNFLLSTGNGGVVTLKNSIWLGKMVTQNGEGAISGLDSLWIGDLEIADEKSGRVAFLDSQWRGNVRSEGTGSRVALNHSQWTGDFLQTNENGEISGNFLQLENGSTWKGNLVHNGENSLGRSDYYITVNNINFGSDLNEWIGDANFRTQGERVYMNSVLNHINWTGNLNFDGVARAENNLSRSLLAINSYSGGSWNGNATIANAAFKTGMSYFTWRGNLEIHESKYNHDPLVDIMLSGESWWIGNGKITADTFNGSSSSIWLGTRSKWIGNLDSSMQTSAGKLRLAIDLTEGSSWEGDANLFFAIPESGVAPDPNEAPNQSEAKFVLSDSTWKGSLTYGADIQSGSSILNINLQNSVWKGDLDIQETLSGGFDHMIQLSNSDWIGSVTSQGQSADVNLFGNSTWVVTGDSQVAQLRMGDSEISFLTRQGAFSTVTVEGDLEASDARFRMNTDLAANVGDLLDVRGTVSNDWGGNYSIYVNNQGSAWVNPSNELTIVKTGGTEDGQFALGNEAVEVGGFEYGLKRVGNDWNLYTTGRSTTTASASLNAFVGSYLLNSAENKTLLKHLGDLRRGSERHGVWARVYGGEFESRGNHFLRGFDMNYSGVQVGYDQKRGSNYFGGLFGYTQGNLDHGAGTSSVDSKSLGVYWTHLGSQGFYTDLVLKYGWMNHDFKVLDSSGATIQGEGIDTSGWSGSLEVGKHIYLDSEKKDRWYLEPQAQLTISRQSGDSFTASNGLQIQVDSLKSVLGRIGLHMGYEVKSGKNPIHLYGKVSYLHEFEGDIGVSYNGIRATEHLGDNWWSYGIGATTQLGKNHRLYLDIERADGARFRQPWAISGSYRFSW